MGCPDVIRDGGCPPRDAATVEECLHSDAGFFGMVCFTEEALAPYRTTPADPNRDSCASPTVCPQPYQLTRLSFCGGSIVISLGMVGDRCCYQLSGPPVDGRPFIIAGTARRATIVEREDWLAKSSQAENAGTPRDRECLAAAWLADATAEHASIASFARLTLELLSLSAPPELLVAAQQAALDEIEHARLCFAMASRYAGRPCGPSKLSMDGAVRNITLSELAVSAVHEGCVGETVAAVLAGERLARAVDPQVRGALAKIADDEARHAALAWRTVVWAIGEGGPSVGEAVRAAFADAVARSLHGADIEAEPDATGDLVAHGQMPAADARRVERAVLRELVIPLAAMLMKRDPAASSEQAMC